MVQCCDRQRRSTGRPGGGAALPLICVPPLKNQKILSFIILIRQCILFGPVTVSTHMQIGAATLVLTGIDSILFFKKLCSNKSTIENKLMTDVKKVNKQMLTGKTSEHQRIPVVKEKTNE